MAESMMDKSMPPMGQPIMDEEDQDIIVEEEEGEIEEDPNELPRVIIEGQDITEELTQELLTDFDANLAELLEEKELTDISNELIGFYEEDSSGRQEWQDAYTDGLDLLGIKYEEREEPFRGSSGVTHPLIAEAVTQFQAQAYKELLPSSGPVRTQVIGTSTPQTVAQSQRIQDFMNYQIVHVMDEYDPEMDRLLFYLPLAGSAFKKVYFDDILDRAVSRFVPADDLVVPYNATDLASASRITHVVRMSMNDVRKYQAGGFYRDIELSPYTEDDELKKKERELSGVQKTADGEECTLLEIHTDLDLTGFEHINPLDEEKTGIKIPYIVTIDLSSQKILAIRRNYTEGDEFFRKQQYFTHYKFLPGLGFYGFGLLHMIGGLGRSATSILRQLIDAGTLANLPAGFKARGIRIRDSDEPLSPGEFRDIDSPGGALRESIIPLPYKEPSQTLMSLLGFVVDAGRRFAMVADMQTGETKQNQAVGTTLALLERGSRVMSAIHKRMYYAQKQEFRMLARIFSESLPPMYPYQHVGVDAMIKQSDFDDRVDVVPVADPNIFSMAQRMTLAQTQLQLAQSNPQLHNIYEAYRRMYESIGVQNIETILPPPQPPQPMDPAIENSMALLQKPLKAFPQQDHDAHITSHLAFMKTPVTANSPAIFGALLSHVSEHIALKARNMANAEMEQIMQEAMSLGQQPIPFDVESRVAQLIAVITQEVMAQLMPPPKGPDPLVALRARELDIKELDLQRKASEFQQRQGFEVDKEASRQDLTREKIDSTEDIAQLRANVNLERINRSTPGRGE